MTKQTLTPDSLALFLALANDADNWSGTPLVGTDKASRGNLTHLKKLGLLTTFASGGEMWVSFSPAGKALAAQHGITLR